MAWHSIALVQWRRLPRRICIARRTYTSSSLDVDPRSRLGPPLFVGPRRVRRLEPTMWRRCQANVGVDMPSVTLHVAPVKNYQIEAGMDDTFNPDGPREQRWRGTISHADLSPTRPWALPSVLPDAAVPPAIIEPFECGSFEDDLWVHSEVIARKVLLRKAVDRNRAKRRLRDAARHIFPSYACRHHQYLLVARAQVMSTSMGEIRWDLIGALRQAGCLLHEPVQVASYKLPGQRAVMTGLEKQ